MTSSKIQFDVQMTCQNCENSIKKVLSELNGINDCQVNWELGSVIVDTELPYTVVQEKIESTGKKAVLKGYGEAEYSAVSMLGGNSGYSFGENIKGVVRFIQSGNGCIIDGTVDGLTAGPHGLHIYECGDISNGCDSIGEHYNPRGAPHGGPKDDPSRRHIGDLGNVVADEKGRATFRAIDSLLQVPEIIGRSLAITENEDDLGRGNNECSQINGNSGKKLACGIIARSSGLFQNTKKICACDGLTIWEERDKSLQKQQSGHAITNNA